VWRYAWVGPPLGGRDEDDRMIDRWRPEPDHTGWARMLSISTRSEDITDVAPDDPAVRRRLDTDAGGKGGRKSTLS
jgi:hypothetical protein